jgi:hypothetical protein
MLTPNEAYQYDPTFRRVVDLMCAYLSEYEITPAELRQAAILAATMHADRCIKPLYIAKPKSWEGMQVFIDEAKDIPPAMFGVPVTDAELNRTVSGSMFHDQWSDKAYVNRAASGSMLGCETGRIQTSVSNFTEQDKQAGLEHDYTMMLKYNCICSTPYWGQAHSSTCRDYNWDVTHSKPEHCHIFRASGHGYDVCNDCGMSDVYYWAYNKIKHDTDGWRDPA